MSHALEALAGARLVGVRRMRYWHGGELFNDNGALELTTEPGGTIWMDAWVDGSELKVRTGPWVDHFAEPLSEENARWVEEAGKWVAHEVASEEPWARLLGRRIEAVELRWSAYPPPVVIGASLTLGDVIVDLDTFEADDLFLAVRPSSP